jgi:hypothetical protein
MIMAGVFSYLNQKFYTSEIKVWFCLTDVRVLRKIAESGSEKVT